VKSADYIENKPKIGVEVVVGMGGEKRWRSGKAVHAQERDNREGRAGSDASHDLEQERNVENQSDY